MDVRRKPIRKDWLEGADIAEDTECIVSEELKMFKVERI